MKSASKKTALHTRKQAARHLKLAFDSHEPRRVAAAFKTIGRSPVAASLAKELRISDRELRHNLLSGADGFADLLRAFMSVGVKIIVEPLSATPPKVA